MAISDPKPSKITFREWAEKWYTENAPSIDVTSAVTNDLYKKVIIRLDLVLGTELSRIDTENGYSGRKYFFRADDFETDADRFLHLNQKRRTFDNYLKQYTAVRQNIDALHDYLHRPQYKAEDVRLKIENAEYRRSKIKAKLDELWESNIMFDDPTQGDCPYGSGRYFDILLPQEEELFEILLASIDPPNKEKGIRGSSVLHKLKNDEWETLSEDSRKTVYNLIVNLVKSEHRPNYLYTLLGYNKVGGWYGEIYGDEKLEEIRLRLLEPDVFRFRKTILALCNMYEELSDIDDPTSRKNAQNTFSCELRKFAEKMSATINSLPELVEKTETYTSESAFDELITHLIAQANNSASNL